MGSSLERANLELIPAGVQLLVNQAVFKDEGIVKFILELMGLDKNRRIDKLFETDLSDSKRHIPISSKSRPLKSRKINTIKLLACNYPIFVTIQISCLFALFFGYGTVEDLIRQLAL